MSCGVGQRCGSDLALLWLWRRPAAIAPIRPIAWESPYATSVPPPKKKDKRQKERKKEESRYSIQETQRIPNKIKLNRRKPRHIIIKISKS